MINWDIAKNPLNWIIVVMMIIIFGFGLDLILTYINNEEK